MSEEKTFSNINLLGNTDDRMARLGRAVLALQKLSPLSSYPTRNQVDNLLDSLVNIIYYELGYPNCQFFLADETQTELYCVCGKGFIFEHPEKQPQLKKWRPNLKEEEGQGLIGWVGRHQQAVIVPDVSFDPRFKYFGSARLSRSELTVPLVIGNKLIGVLDLESTEPCAFDDLDLQIVSFFASQAAVMINAYNLAQITAAGIEDLTILALTGSGLNSALSLPEIGRIVLYNVLTASGAYSGDILIQDEQSHVLQRLTTVNLAEKVRELSFNSSDLISKVLGSHQPAFISDLASYSSYNPSPELIESLKAANIGAFSCLPLFVRNEVLGIMFINYKEPHNFTNSEKHLQNIFAAQTAAALLNARVSNREQTARRFAESLARSSRLVSSQLELDAILQTITEEVIKVFGTPMCTISLLDEGTDEIIRIYSRGIQPESIISRLKLGQGYIGTVAATGKMWKEYDIALLPEFANNPVRVRENWHASLALPIKVGGPNARIIGVLSTHDKVPREFSSSEVAYLEGLTDQAAVAIANAEFYAALRRERDMYHALLENANDPIFLLDPASGEILDVNQRAIESTGYAYLELLHKPASLLYLPEEQAKLNQLHSQQMLNGTSPATYVENIIVRRKDGSTFPASYSARLVKIGREQVIIQIWRDMSEHRAMEQQLVRNEQLRALGQLASGVAHDFNNLLTGILGISELLLSGVPENDMRGLLRMLRQSALDGAQMVRRVQLIGPSQSGAEFSAVELNSILRDVIELTRSRWRGEAQQRGIAIEVELETELLPPVKGNASELREVITNLVLNAIDAMPAGGRLGLRSALKPGEVWLVIEDTGIGMSEETRRHLFEPFFTTKAREGHGLGLSVSNSIIARHGGTIVVDSRLGQGSIFTIKLPLSQPVPPKAEPEAVATVRPLRILVVDDDPNLLYILTRILQTDHHTVTSTASGLEAVEIFRSRPDAFDLIFTDLTIQDLNGWEIARSVKNLRPNTPVVLVTGWGADLNPEMLQHYQISEVVNKPYRLNDVQAVIRRVMEKK